MAKLPVSWNSSIKHVIIYQWRCLWECLSKPSSDIAGKILSKAWRDLVLTSTESSHWNVFAVGSTILSRSVKCQEIWSGTQNKCYFAASREKIHFKTDQQRWGESRVYRGESTLEQWTRFTIRGANFVRHRFGFVENAMNHWIIE